MRSESSSFSRLINEFSNINVEIEIGEKSWLDGSSGQAIEDGWFDYPTIYEFYFKFQNERKVYFIDYTYNGEEYTEKLNNLRSAFYKEIKNEIKTSGNKSIILGSLGEYKSKFSVILDDYYDYRYVLPAGKIKLKNRKNVRIHFSEEKPIHDFDRARILNIFLTIQYQTVRKILKYLNEKIKLINDQIQEDYSVSIPND